MNKKGFSVVGLLVTIVVIALIAAAVYFFFFRGGSGFGFGKGSNKKTDTPAAEAMVTADTDDTEYIEVTVDVNDYILDGSTVTIEDIIAKNSDGAKFRITDKNASKNAYDDLIAELDKNGISYIEASAEDSAA